MSADISEILRIEDFHLTLPYAVSRVKAGFPSPADDYIEKSLDFNEYLIKRPAATFCVRVSGDSMINAGIHDSDLLIVDRSINPSHNSIIIAVIDGEMTLKRLVRSNGRVILQAENPDYPSIIITDEMNFEVWGVVSFVIHRAL
ncbi:MAG TPA: translesion error-prone DNA polymerase V autoproteolytic subunit [Spirochaetota bacterium]|nr:translesion error-prone DNA polymerase V autoproteolytic subunit [Spirochaetota bacterium]HQO22902.1 translesion error-prone DNA polymerase V autoproteolytic subunit [Spirochaetota bacterium]HQQ22491.1 translesion error-prone DNA polymerase V autoproteolytic subunit [Spirochaetota bacterium]